MNPNTQSPTRHSLENQFCAFSMAQMTSLNAKDISQSTFATLLACTFFVAALKEMTKNKNAQTLNAAQRRILGQFLVETFKTQQRNSEQLIDSLERLINKYTLMKEIHDQGRQAAQNWFQEGAKTCTELKLLLDKYKHLSMSELGSKGINPAQPKQHPGASYHDKPNLHYISPTHRIRGAKTLQYIVISILISALLTVVLLHFNWFKF